MNNHTEMTDQEFEELKQEIRQEAEKLDRLQELYFEQVGQRYNVKADRMRRWLGGEA